MTQVVFQQAVDLLNKGQAQQANQILTTLIKKEPNNINVLSALAYSCLVLQQHEMAISYFRKVTELVPKQVSAWADLAVVCYQNEKYDDAESALRTCIDLDPNFGNGQAWQYLANVMFVKKQFEHIPQCEEKIDELDPNSPIILRINEQLEAGNLDQVEALSKQVLQASPQHPKALYFLAWSQSQKGLYEQAIHSLNLALTQVKFELNVRTLLAQIYIQIRDYEEALAHANILVEQKPEELNNWLLYADVLVNLAQYDKALNAYQRALEISEDHYYIWLQQAHIHKILGNSEQCIALYSQCLTNDEVKGSAYWGLSNIRGYQFDDESIEQLQSTQLDPDLPAEQASQASFALARAYEQNKEYGKAFSAYQYANNNKQGSRFNVQAYINKTDALINTFHSRLYEKAKHQSKQNKHAITPIFIVGLPRVGSTLVEQILSSHSQVEATMELKVLPAIARQVFLASCEKNQNNSGLLDKFDNQELLEFGQQYLDKTKVYRTDKPYFIDKLPPNFQHIGLIKLILPQALVIDVRRHPLSCGLGIYRQHFGQGFDFAYDLAHIGHYYGQYRRLMEHWQSLFSEQVHLCQYESLVDDLDSEVKALLTYCGLEFEKQCLTFYENNRAVRTASSEQVRQPINKKGISLWQNYEEQLQPLVGVLDEYDLTY